MSQRSRDISELLRAWPHERGRLAARIIEGDDEVPKLQVRLDLGILQMELDGRPDGLEPEGAATLFDHLQQRIRTSGGELDEAACRGLREEAVQVYHRYVALFSLGEYERVVRDTRRNLAVIDFCRQHAAREEDRVMLEQFRPAVIAMRARAEAEAAVTRREPREAVAALDAALDEMRSFFDEHAEPELRDEVFERSGEAQLLRGMRDALVPKLPASQRAELEERLRAALDAENYELAAILRDELRMM
jgi:hypothetical protein